MPEQHDIHYLRHVTAMGQNRPVVSTQAIYTQSGIKLLDVGIRISGALYDKLVAQTLLRPIDECLSVEDAVSGTSLRHDLEAMLLEIENSGGPKASSKQRERVLKVCVCVPLPPLLAFKLTVMREQRPQIYRHTLQVVLVAVFLAIAAGQTQRQMTLAAAAALFHDMGQLQIDPAIADDARHLDENQLRYFDTHPIAAYLILKAIPELDPSVAIAVLNHHERLDGSGYPRRMTGNAIDSLGQLLAVADVGAAILWRKKSAAYRPLSMALRFNQGKLNAQFGQTLLDFVWSLGNNQPDIVTTTALPLPDSFKKLSGAMKELHSITSDLPAGSALLPLQTLTQERLDQLKHQLASAGVDLDQDVASFADPNADVQWIAEMHCIFNEAIWQLRAVARELRRRARDLPIEDDAGRRTLFAQLEKIEQA